MSQINKYDFTHFKYLKSLTILTVATLKNFNNNSKIIENIEINYTHCHWNPEHSELKKCVKNFLYLNFLVVNLMKNELILDTFSLLRVSKNSIA